MSSSSVFVIESCSPSYLSDCSQSSYDSDASYISDMKNEPTSPSAVVTRPCGFDSGINTVVTTNGNKKRERGVTMIMDILQSIQPTDYVKAAFKANGCDDFDAINQASLSRFQSPTKEMIDAYYETTEIVASVRSCDIVTARRLHREGKFDCNACNRFGESILHIACRRGHYEMVKFLIETVGLRAHEIRDDYHRTPLHDAFWTSTASYDVVDFLLKQPHVVELLLLKDSRGCTPLEYSRKEDRGKWLRFLWERKCWFRTATVTTTENDEKKANVTDVNVSSPATTIIVTKKRNDQQENDIDDHGSCAPPVNKRQRSCSESIPRTVSLVEITQ